VVAAKIAPLREMPLDEKIEGFNCRTGNYMLFHFFHLRHRLPGSAALIISQNFASCRLASALKKTFLLVFIPISPPFLIYLAWVQMGCGTLDLFRGSLYFPSKMNKIGGKVNKENPVFSQKKDCIS
jgi:hypothetical protein